MDQTQTTVVVNVVKDQGGFYSTPISMRISCDYTSNEPQTLTKILQGTSSPGICSAGMFQIGDRVPDEFPNSVKTMMLTGPDGYTWITIESYSDFLAGCNLCCSGD